MSTRAVLCALAGSWLLLSGGATRPASAGQGWPSFTPEQVGRGTALVAQYRQAVRAGETAPAIDLLCRMNADGLMFAGHPNAERFQAWADSARAMFHRRYDEVFHPMANADAMADMDVSPAGAPAVSTSAWNELPPFYAFNRDGVSSTGDGSETRYYPGRERESRPFAIARTSALTIDLDRDGTPELSFDGREATIAPGLTAAIDRAPDGRRAQWLVSPLGVEPRAQARIWLYHDGALCVWLLDTDGDGRGNCGSGPALPVSQR